MSTGRYCHCCTGRCVVSCTTVNGSTWAAAVLNSCCLWARVAFGPLLRLPPALQTMTAVHGCWLSQSVAHVVLSLPLLLLLWLAYRPVVCTQSLTPSFPPSLTLLQAVECRSAEGAAEKLSLAFAAAKSESAVERLTDWQESELEQRSGSGGGCGGGSSKARLNVVRLSQDELGFRCVCVCVGGG